MMNPTRRLNLAILAVICTLAGGGLALGVAPAFAAAPEAPEASVETPVRATEVTFHGVVSPNAATFPVEAGTYQFVYRPSTKAEDKCKGSGETPAPASAGMYLGLEPESFSETVTGLTANTEYAVCLVAEDTGGKAVSTPPVQFETALPPETPEPKPANPIAANTATLNGVLNPAAPGDAGTYEFFYQQSETECQGEHQQTASGAATGAKGELAEAKVTGLLPHKPYTFCLLAKNAAGEESALSGPETFTTPAAEPRIEEQSISDVADTSATLNATVNPEGAETTYAFEYAPAGGAFAPVTEPGGSGTLPEGVSGVPVSVHVQHGLVAGASYEFRVVVGNSVQQGVTGKPAVLFTTQSASTTFALPDNRQWEMVSPPQKEGALITWNLGAGLTEAATDGDAITYASEIPTEANPMGFDNKTQELSTRGPDGWQTRDLLVPHATETGSSIGQGVEYRFFSSDLSQAIVQPFGLFTPCTSAQGAAQPCLSPEASEPTAYLNDLGTGAFTPLVTSANVPPGTVFGGVQEYSGRECEAVQYCGPFAVAATSDLSHVVLQSDTSLTPGGANGLYESSAGKLTFIGTSNGSEAVEGADAAHGAHGISADGSRVVFNGSSENAKHEAIEGLLLRDTVSEEAVQLNKGLPETEFQTASASDSRVFFNAGWNGQLYVWEQTSGTGEPLAGSVTELTGQQGIKGLVLGVSEDGSYVYFVSGGVLAGSGATSIGENLYVDHYDGSSWKPTFIAALSSADEYDWDGNESFWGSAPLEQQTARVSSNGQWLAFMSEARLTGYDNRDAVNPGKSDAEVFLYHAEESGGAPTLTCASCEPSGARPIGVEYKKLQPPGLAGSFRAWPANALVAANIPGWYGASPERLVPESYQPRYLSDGGRLFFNSDDALVPQDVNGTEDVYEYEPEGEGNCTSSTSSGSVIFKPAHGVEGAGCVGLISSGSSSEESAFLDASESGSEVFFLTAAKLVPQDVDTALDVYDAHECTGASPCLSAPVAPPPCDTEASCKPAPEPQPSIYGVGPSETFTGPGNLAPITPAVVKKVTKKTVKCKRGLVKNKKNRCVKKPKKKKLKAKKSAHINRRTK